MMENCERGPMGNERINSKDKMELEETIEFVKCEKFEENKQNFDFGAEISNSEILSQNVERTKTNLVNVTTTSAIVSESVKEVNLTDNPLNVSELPNINYDPAVLVDEHGNSDEDDEESDDVGGDSSDNSYQSDDDDNEHESLELLRDDEENENQQHSSCRQQLDDMSQDSDEESTSDDSDFSDFSGLSDMSGREWKPNTTRPINWVQKQIHSGADPRELLSQMLPSSAHQIAPGLDDMMLWRILASMLSEPPRRQKLSSVNTFEDVIKLVKQSHNIIVLTGAGVSVSCGIPDFRSSDGIYSRLAKDYPDLPDPQAMFDINYFSRDPRPFYKFAREIYPGQFKPSPCHRFIKLLEQKQKLLRNYTQNIDTLEQVAGIRNVIECHGSFSTASCTKCKIKCSADDIRQDIFTQRIPVCHRCQPNVHQSVDASEPVSEFELRRLVENGIMKPDIVFFGEGLPEEFHTVMASDKDKCDLLIVMGSSLKVRPVALIPSSIPANVPQILINREQLHHLEFDVELLGDSDVIINQLCHHLSDDWKGLCFSDDVMKESKELLPLEEDTITESSEEDAQQLQDTDTQSVKSSASTDIALRSAGAYSDSGFESSTSSGLVVAKPNNGNNGEVSQPIEKIKMTILELASPPNTKTKSANLLPPHLLDDPNDAMDFGNTNFHQYAERLGQDRGTSCGENYRHLSIDSSKDSGIQCDSSNSALPVSSSNVVGALPPPITNLGDGGGTMKYMSSTISSIYSAHETANASASQTSRQTALNTSTKTEADVSANEKRESNLKCRQQQQRPRPQLTAAERLLEGTYYRHDNSSSYVFPGAQVAWCSNAEIEDTDDNDNDDFDDEGDAEANAAPFSPLLPPSIEAEMVSEITATSAFVACAKRHSSVDSNRQETTTTTTSCSITSSISNNEYKEKETSKTVQDTCEEEPPSAKRKRCETIERQIEVGKNAASFIAAATTKNTKTINSSISSKTHTSKEKKQVVSNSTSEALLQQF